MPKTIFEIIRLVSLNYAIAGFTITGGDPFYQLEELKKLLDKLKEISDDILAYTDYKRSEL